MHITRIEKVESRVQLSREKCKERMRGREREREGDRGTRGAREEMK